MKPCEPGGEATYERSLVDAIRTLAESYTTPRRLWEVAAVSLEGQHPDTVLVIQVRVADAGRETSIDHEVAYRIWHDYGQWGSWDGGPPTPRGVANAIL